MCGGGGNVCFPKTEVLLSKQMSLPRASPSTALNHVSPLRIGDAGTKAFTIFHKHKFFSFLTATTPREMRKTDVASLASSGHVSTASQSDSRSGTTPTTAG